jgi:two-component system, response regulator PdtaR
MRGTLLKNASRHLGYQMTARQPRLRILVVENEMLLRLVAEELVLKLGHDIVGWASSAHGAIAEAERTRPDIVLMDIQLDGEGDGVDAAREIRDRLGIASLFTTGRADPETHKRALLTRPLGYLRKPLTHADLDAALDRHPRTAVPRPQPSQASQAPTPSATEGVGQRLSMSEDAILQMPGKMPSESFE